MTFLYLLAVLIFWVLPITLIMFSSEAEYAQPTDRVLWFLLVFFLPPIGGVLFCVRLICRAMGLGTQATPITDHFRDRPYQAGDLRRAGE